MKFSMKHQDNMYIIYQFYMRNIDCDAYLSIFLTGKLVVITTFGLRVWGLQNHPKNYGRHNGAKGYGDIQPKRYNP